MYGKAFLEKPRKVRENLLTKMEIPEDLAGREPIITIAGSTNAVIENYRSILSYTSENGNPYLLWENMHYREKSGNLYL